jgi:predicted nuclease of predicted toxin-antitoxin system
VKVLLDHNIPHDLRPLFPDEVEVYTAAYLGWSDLEDADLLRAAVEETFSVVVTLDRNLSHQQDLDAYDVGIVVLAIHPATPARLKREMNRVVDALPKAASNQVVVVDG